MQIARVFFDVHMGQNFKGLMDMCKKNHINVSYSQYILFINKKRTKFKMFVGDKYLVYHDNRGQAFPLEAIKNLPLAFEGDTFDFSKAITKTVEEKFRSLQ
jgi:hypothetical protein